MLKDKVCACVCGHGLYLVWYSLHWKLSGNISKRLHIHMYNNRHTNSYSALG